MKIVITGGKGRLGSRLTTLLSTIADNKVLSYDRSDLNILDFAEVRDRLWDVKPDLVIHCAAWTNVDACANDPEQAMMINGYGAGNIAAAAARSQAAVLYVSSNEVFDGRQPERQYYEYDTPNPINPYGYSKYLGEQEVARLNPKHYIVRTSWLFAHGGKNFMQTMINAAKAGKNLRVVIDEVANPTYTDDLADAITRLIETRRYGTYHFVNEGSVSRWGFARYILDRAGFGETPIDKISKKEWQRPSNPPEYCSMANVAGQQLGISLRPWQDAVDVFLKKEGLYV